MIFDRKGDKIGNGIKSVIEATLDIPSKFDYEVLVYSSPAKISVKAPSGLKKEFPMNSLTHSYINKDVSVKKVREQIESVVNAVKEVETWVDDVTSTVTVTTWTVQ